MLVINNTVECEWARRSSDVSSYITIDEDNLDCVLKNQPFKVYSNDEMKELKESIERIGLQNPIIVRRLENNQYEILAGHNRVRAFKELL